MSTPRGHAFDPERLLRTLTTHGVRYVLIGGWAAKLQGSPSVTADIDISYDRSSDNLDRLANALSGLDVRLRGVPDDIPFVLDKRSLRSSELLTLTSSYGDIDLIGDPAGSSGFDALEAHADTLELDDLHVRVASIDDLIAMKSAAGRPKDRVEVEILEALRDEVQQRKD